MLFDLRKEEPSIIKIIGVGGGGSNAVTYMYKQGIIGVDYAICNTDAQAMSLSPVPVKIPLGASLTEGRGAGSKPEIGKRACMESIEEIKRFLDNGAKMVFITAGMGGGTGTGAAPIIAKTAQEMGILTVGIVTLPFSFEGRTRVNNGYEGLEELRKNVDCLVVISNDKLRLIYGNMSVSSAFAQADSILCTAAKGIAEIITVPGYVNVDFEDVNTVMRGSGVAVMGTAAVEGEGRARRAVDEALNSPLLEDNNIFGAKNILVNITSGTKEATMDEIFEITEFIQQEAGENANLIWGNCFDERLGEKISVTIIATGFEASRKTPQVPAAAARLQTPASNGIKQMLHLDEDAPKPSLATITGQVEEEPTESKKAPTIEFDFDSVRATVDSARPKSDEPFVKPDCVPAPEPTPEERHQRLIEAQRRRQEAQNRQVNPIKLNSPQTIIELENQPAYLRQGIKLDEVPEANAREMSDLTISIEGDKAEIRPKGNSYLHEKAD
ncbi:MAG: cell division protein FtsZ [Saprospiraceae bacterium]|nr:cell division protein FtsZ [Saprospiraceae bacterium]MDW8229797.1 cell division protein FtsZ [Saprospiraceae bacterium]